MAILHFHQKWADEHHSPDNRYWIAADPTASRIQYGDGMIVLGRDCSTLAELETVAEEIRRDLDRVMAEARKKLGSSN